MAYTLTLEDLQKLEAMGVNVNGVPEGAEATPEEMQALGVTDPTAIVPEQPSIPVTAPDNPSVKQVPAGPVKPLPDSQPAAGPDMSGLLAMLAQQSQAPTDPYENLSKRQRMMLGFAAIQDAGQALLGKEGRSFERLMGRFNDMTDMERKRQAAQAQRQMIGQLIKGGDVGDINAYKQQILALAMSGAIDGATLAALMSEANLKQEQQRASEAVAVGASTSIDNIGELRDLLSSTDMATGAVGWALGQLPWSDAYSARNLAKTLESNMALGALKNLKASGATLGAVSEKELDLLLSDIRRLDLNQKKDKVLTDLNVIENAYKKMIRKAYRTGDTNALDAALGGRPSWLDEAQPSKTKTPKPQSTDTQQSDEELFQEFGF